MPLFLLLPAVHINIINPEWMQQRRWYLQAEVLKQYTQTLWEECSTLTCCRPQDLLHISPPTVPTPVQPHRPVYSCTDTENIQTISFLVWKLQNTWQLVQQFQPDACITHGGLQAYIFQMALARLQLGQNWTCCHSRKISSCSGSHQLHLAQPRPEMCQKKPPSHTRTSNLKGVCHVQRTLKT